MNEETQTKNNINWYPGHMAKTKRLIKENLNLIDIIYEVIDARIPLSSKIKDIDDLVKNKPRILIFTKYDLCDKNETDKFIKKYEEQGLYTLKYDLTKENNFKDLYELSNKILSDKLSKRVDKGIINKNIRALVIGIPNAGKSTLINKIAKEKKVNVGNKPGVTKNLNWIKTKTNIELLDTPGILWPRLEQDITALNLASLTAIKEEILPLEDVSIYILNTLSKYYPSILKENFKIDNVSDIEIVFDQIGKNKGLLSKGGVVDYDRVIALIINNVKSGKIKDITFDRYEDFK
jgi:ribosome biogenesis GTP-binding protein YlqF